MDINEDCSKTNAKKRKSQHYGGFSEGGCKGSLKKFALCIRVSSFFPARVPGLRAGKNDTIPVAPVASVAPVAPVARRRIVDYKGQV